MFCPPYLPIWPWRLYSALLSAVCAFDLAVSSMTLSDWPPTTSVFAFAIYPPYARVTVLPETEHVAPNVTVSPDADALAAGQ